MKKIPETIRLSPANIQRISQIGKFGESFDDVIGRLLDFFEESNKKKK
jgi:hypothetical protein